MGSSTEFHYGSDDEEENSEDNEIDVGDDTGHISREKKNDHNKVKRNARVPRGTEVFQSVLILIAVNS